MAKDESVANRLSRDKDTRSTYNELLERSGPLNKGNKRYSRDIFILALAYGYINNIRIPLEKSEQFVNYENMGDNLPVFLKALGITNSDEGVEILSAIPSEIYEVSEQYANGGLDLLNSEYVGHEDEFIENLRLKIIELNDNDKILDKVKELKL